MLTDNEQAACRSILKLLKQADLFSLLETVTNKTIHASSDKEAIAAILSFSESAESLLKRRKISKDILLRYFYDRKYHPLSPNWSKDELITKLLDNLSRESSSAVPVSPQRSLTNYHSSHSTLSPSTPQDKLPISGAQSETLQTFAGVPGAPQTLIQNITVNVNYNATSAVQTQELVGAVKFVSWFFKKLNSLNPSSNVEEENFGPHDFWDNAELHVHLASQSSVSTEDVCGSVNVAERLATFTSHQMLLFNPNLSEEGVSVRSDPHGLKLILACGSLHKDNSCVGIFQQSFGLVQDPRSVDFWKLKVSYLKMQECSAQDLPKLQDAGDSAIIEGLTVKALEGAVSGSE